MKRWTWRTCAWCCSGRLALLAGDRDEIVETRRRTHEVIGAWAVTIHLEKLEPLERATRAAGIDVEAAALSASE